MAVAVAVMVAALLAELVLRIYVAARGWTPNCYAGSVQLRVPDEVNGYRLASDFHLRSGVYTITTNRQGLRGPQITPDKPPGVQRIALLGGSSAFGYLVSDGQEAARLLEGGLRAAGHHVEVLNGGVPGYNLFQSTHRYIERIRPLQPDVVVLYLGWNDLAYLVSDTPSAEPFRRGEPAPAWQRWLSHSTLYGLLAFRVLTPAAVFVPPAATRSAPTEAGALQFETNLRRLIEEIRADGAEPVIVAQATAAHPEAADEVRRFLGGTDEQQQQNAALGQWLHQSLQRVARDEDVLFVDAFEEIPATTQNLADATHLSAAGEQRLANLLEQHLRGSVLESPDSSP